MREPCHSAPECTTGASGARERAVVRGAQVVQDRHEQAFELGGRGGGLGTHRRLDLRRLERDRWLRSPLSGLDLDRFGLGRGLGARARGAAPPSAPCSTSPRAARGSPRAARGGRPAAGCRSRSPQDRRKVMRRRRARARARGGSGSGSGSGGAATGAASGSARDRDLRAPPGGRELHRAAYKRALPGDGGLGLHPGDAHLTERGQPSGEGLRVADLRPEFGRGLHEGALRTGLGHDEDGFGIPAHASCHDADPATSLPRRQFRRNHRPHA